MPATAPTLRTDAFQRECARAKLFGDAAIAEAFGLDRVSVWRITTGRRNVSAAFINAALTVLHRSRFEDIFEVAA